MVGVGIFSILLWVLFGNVYSYDLDSEALGLVYGPISNLALVSVTIALALYLKPGLESLPFSPWWLVTLVVPLAILSLTTIVLLRSEIPFATSRFSTSFGITLLAIGLVALITAFELVWFRSWIMPMPLKQSTEDEDNRSLLKYEPAATPPCSPYRRFFRHPIRQYQPA